jgi:hypothetical protein
MIPFLIKTAEKNGVRLTESDFQNEDIECLNQHVVIFRGRALDLFDRIFEGDKRSLAAQQVPHSADSLAASGGGSVRSGRDVVRLETIREWWFGPLGAETAKGIESGHEEGTKSEIISPVKNKGQQTG